MTEFCKLNPTPYGLEAINQCRLYLQAYYISDLATASGTSLSYHVWEGAPRSFGKTSRCNWPNQGTPGRTSCEICRKYIKATLLSRGMRLKENLGSWI
jgi:hypothetical protein